MGRRKATRPTDAEMEILSVLWDAGPATVRDIAETLNRTRPTQYTTVLKLLQIMFRKGLVLRDESRRTHVYSAAQPPESTRTSMVADMVERVFAGSRAGLVNALIRDPDLTPADLDELRRIIDQHLEGGRAHD